MKLSKIKESKTLFSLIVLNVIIISSSFVLANFDDTDYDLAIEEKRYQDALTIIENKDESKRTVLEKELIDSLSIVIEINQMEWPKNSMALKEDEVDPEVLKTVNQYYKAAVKNFLEGKRNITKYVLFQTLFIYPDYPKAVSFLEKGFNYPPGAYPVKDQSKHLLSRSDNYFYGGNYLKAAEDLEILTILNKKSATIYEKLGSAYYMMNQKQKSIDVWSVALFYNPENKQLEEMIESTKEMIIEDAKAVSELSESEKDVVVIDDPQIMGVFKSQSEAFDLTKNLRSQGLLVVIEENESGKWVVQVSRKQLQEKNAKKGKEE